MQQGTGLDGKLGDFCALALQMELGGWVWSELRNQNAKTAGLEPPSSLHTFF